MAALAAQLSHSGPGAQSRLCDATPSRHRLHIAGQLVHTPCVLDALMLPYLRGLPGEVHSDCPATGRVILFDIDPAGRATIAPTTAVVSLGAGWVRGAASRENVCPYLNAFPTDDAYRRWAACTPQAITIALPADDATTLARSLAHREHAR